MNAIPFDTLKLTRGLQTAGLDAPMAVSVAEAITVAVGEANLATKDDLAHEVGLAKSTLTQEIERVETTLTQKIERVEATLTQKIERVESTLTQEIKRVENDLKSVEARLSHRIDMVENAINRRIDGVEHALELLRRDMTVKLGSMIFIATGVILAAMRFMPHAQ